jgi:TPR repeat protein
MFSRHWQSCMLYTMLLERGDVVPQDRAREVALVQYACSKDHFRARESLKERGIRLVASPTLPERPTWIKQPKADPPSSFTVTLPPAPPSFEERLMQLQRERGPIPPEKPLSTDDPVESELIERCLSGKRSDCFNLARGYDQGTGVPQDAARATSTTTKRARRVTLRRALTLASRPPRPRGAARGSAPEAS